MGKVKRERQKYHLSRVKTTQDVSETQNVTSSSMQLPETSTLIPVPEDIFAGINISIDNLKHSLKDSDVRSVISNNTLSVRNNITKKEKKRLRHEAFLRKLQVTHMLMKDMKNRTLKKKSRKSKCQSSLDKLQALDLNLKVNDKNASSTKKKLGLKQRSVPKAKYRKKIMLQDVALFKSLLAEQESQTDPIASISNHIQSKVYEEVKSDVSSTNKPM